MMRSVLFALVLAACSTQTAIDDSDLDGKADGTDSVPKITFRDDFTQGVTGTLQAGAKVKIAYDIDRLQDCRGEDQGVEVFGVTGHAAFDGGETIDFEASKLNTSDDVVAKLATITIPAGTNEISLWFTISNKWGCQAYDSNYGENYVFSVAGGSGGGGDSVVIDFDAAMHEIQSDVIHSGDTVVIHYDPARLASSCSGTQYGTAAWNITGHYRFDDGEFATLAVARVEGLALVAADPEIVAAGSELEIYFECNNRWGNHDYDSDFGANYHFAVR
jgi:hypothetical protein